MEWEGDRRVPDVVGLYLECKPSVSVDIQFSLYFILLIAGKEEVANAPTSPRCSSELPQQAPERDVADGLKEISNLSFHGVLDPFSWAKNLTPK